MVVYALSKKDENVQALLCVILIIQPNWVVVAREEWKTHLSILTLIQNLQMDASVSDTFAWKNDSLWYKDHLYICKNYQLKQKILLELHTSPSNRWALTIPDNMPQGQEDFFLGRS